MQAFGFFLISIISREFQQWEQRSAIFDVNGKKKRQAEVTGVGGGGCCLQVIPSHYLPLLLSPFPFQEGSVAWSNSVKDQEGEGAEPRPGLVREKKIGPVCAIRIIEVFPVIFLAKMVKSSTINLTVIYGALKVFTLKQ